MTDKNINFPKVKARMLTLDESLRLQTMQLSKVN